ncbi:MAG: sigma 54-interacting transcriptional regulator, partial [Deltaproteobacteria bacterium]|nr:sigma 54-interacting transcriptional regulator [Deltaproteobacteria bacterium]
ELPQPLQAKLLRVIEDRELTPLGAVKPIKVNVRFVAATNRDLSKMMEAGTFRKDLYFRLDVAKIKLPPLRERREDIPLLIEHSIEKLNLLRKRNIAGVSPEVVSILMRYAFPGNVRELENILEFASILCKGRIIEKEHLPRELLESLPNDVADEGPPLSPLEEAEAKTLRRLLERYRNRSRVAKEIGVSRTTLWRKLKRYGIED